MDLQYIGARYVPKFYENSQNPSSMDWESGHGYEALTVVTYNSDTYTSKIPVPSTVGDPASNPSYWAKTADYNAALQGLQNEINALDDNIGVFNMNYFENKKVLILGDSISNEAVNAPNWVAKLRQKTANINCTIDNRATSGFDLATNGGVAALFASISGNYDIIIIFAGTNDCTGQIPIGTYTDSTLSTFWGALNSINTTIVNNHLNSDVFFITPLHNWLSDSTYPRPINLNAYRSVIQSACKLYNWTMIDGTQAPKLNVANPTVRSLYMSDGIHPNTAYAQFLCDYILQKILSKGDSVLCSYDTVKTFNVSFGSGTLAVRYKTNGCFDLIVAITPPTAASGDYSLTAETVPDVIVQTMPLFIKGRTTSGTYIDLPINITASGITLSYDDSVNSIVDTIKDIYYKGNPDLILSY